jgi:arylsulfatase A-like enzyme
MLKMRLIASLLVCLAVVSSAMAAKPNIIVFYADDMGIGDVGAYGCKDIKTPAIDALASSGIRFDQYYSAAPICSPSRAALLTGRYPHRAGVPTNVGSTPGSEGLPNEQLTIAEVAKQAGYQTGIVGKWHLGFVHPCQPNSQGFDFFFGHHAGCIDYYSHTFYWNPHVPHHHDLYRNRTEVFENGQYMTSLITREANAFISANKASPFLLYVPYNAPHYPMHAPKKYWDMYASLSPKRQAYAALVAAMDESIGSIMATIDEAGLRDNTLVFFMSDNGPSVEIRANGGGGSNGPFRDYKFSLFEGGIRMPAIASWPGHLPAGESRDQLAMAIDVLPTIAEVTGVTVPDDYVIDGQSWLPLLRDAKKQGHDALFWEWNKQQAVRSGPWKLVKNGLMMQGMSKRVRASGEDSVFLSRVIDDPGESKNLRHEHPEQVKTLLEQHAAWRQSVGLSNQ